MPRTKRWVAGPTKSGYGEIKMSSWRYFMDYVYQEMLDFDSYVWRGHRCDNWKLESTWDRLCKTAGQNPAQTTLRAEHLERFKFAARGRRGSHPPKLEEENDWWALGQHFGVATPLLDWSTSPFVAAYFAYTRVDTPQTTYRTVYALHRPSMLAKSDEIKKAKEQLNAEKKAEIAKSDSPSALAMVLYDMPVRPEIEFVRPMTDENQNLLNQGGLFSRAPSGQTLDAWVQSNFVGDDTYTLMKILLPNSDRDLALRTLNRMNINHSSLFPDLYGASIYTNLFVQIKKY